MPTTAKPWDAGGACDAGGARLVPRAALHRPADRVGDPGAVADALELALSLPATLAQWQRFSASVQIPSRDEGLIAFKPFGTQTYLVREILAGIEQGTHEFCILKPRQVGASTALMIFTLFWLLKHKGLQGALITEKDKTTHYLRGSLAKIHESLPTPFVYPTSANNRYGIQWANGSRLVYETAGQRKNTGLGKGRGLAYLHATEVSEWGDPDGVDSLRAALSQRHPAACYVWESTAQGFNFFWEMWQDFERGESLRAIFVPWWRHELYQLEPERDAMQRRLFEVYWDGQLMPEEIAWQEQITRRWGVTLRPEQWAWYRWYLSEKARSQLTMHQNYPCLPEHAFQASGGGFIDDGTAFRLRESLAAQPVGTGYRYEFGGTIEASALHETDPKLAHLIVWEPPRDGAIYVVAADPAFGATQASDRAVVQVWRCERHRLVQVAEFCGSDLPLHQFAWVVLHLAGSYYRAPGRSHLILELNGPGRAALQEIQRVMWYGYGSRTPAAIQNVLGAIQHYIYRKPDSLTGGGGMWQWLTTAQTRKMIYEKLRDALLRESRLVIRSIGLVGEITSLTRHGDKVESVGAAHDDRAITAAMAIECWTENVLPSMLMLPEPKEDGVLEVPTAGPVANEVVRSFFERLGVPPAGGQV